MKPSSFLVLEEDEGFSDWSHRLENRHEVQDDCRAQERRPSAPQQKPEAGEEEVEEREREPEQRSKSRDPSPRFPEKVSDAGATLKTSLLNEPFFKFTLLY